jgi:predicted solute-binding protein
MFWPGESNPIPNPFGHIVAAKVLPLPCQVDVLSVHETSRQSFTIAIANVGAADRAVNAHHDDL